MLQLVRQWLKRSPGPPKPAAVGARGERIAARALRRARYKLLYRNFRVRSGEIDLVCRHRPTGVLAFVEVKSRSTEESGRPLEAVDRRKRKRLVRAAYHWLALLDDPAVIFRFDVVEVLLTEPPTVRIIEDAFRPSPQESWRRGGKGR